MSTTLITQPKAIIFDWEGTLVHAGGAMPYAKEILVGLSQLGYHLAVATGKSRKGLDRDITALGWEGIFTITRCAEETRAKPHPAMLMEIVEFLGITPVEAVMIGDTVADLQMAASIGMPAIGVTFGFHHETELLQYGPVACIDTLAVLPKWLTELKEKV